MKIVFAVLPHLIIAVALLGLVFQLVKFSEMRRPPEMAIFIEWPWTIARLLYGSYFIYTAVMIGREIWIGGRGVQQPTPEAKAFYEALQATGFLYPLMGVTFGLGGLALILQRTAPLGLVLLAPSVGVIFLFHLVLTGRIVWGTEWALGLILLAWHYRSAYTALWNYTSAGVAMRANR